MNMKAEERGRWRQWLSRMADAEDKCESVSVGGLAHELGLLQQAPRGSQRVFGRLIEFARRTRGWSVEELARLARVDLEELVSIESDRDFIPQARTVFQLSETLGFKTEMLMELAGLTKERSALVSQAALRFAARSEPMAQLSTEEREAFDEFVKVLVESTDGE